MTTIQQFAGRLLVEGAEKIKKLSREKYKLDDLSLDALDLLLDITEQVRETNPKMADDLQLIYDVLRDNGGKL